ncbi:flavodoxin reductase [Gluconacetobacter sacchari DSM 12717]|uniref:Phenylacetate-CoA oxygenase/reductase subunit PaaK n=2 Tax=Gluconacetobacter sacchari TaxID=92759 RepID=A0A7W4NMD7_9PROT|nr:1,2-phenylacetyl-CoA epoxidase subunit PaaE [Gluconacetobacter sacchari]MBB2160484.1 phenylacetate-CoA oxygenase/reductase subunit PaaK [Gluconacetobacter sacchari]GBQ32790.1 flavodoxin reductase [Gluconacetobacter sacchari DSM 12717]
MAIVHDPLVAAPSASRARVPRFYPLRVTELRRETPDAVSITFEIPDDLREDYRYEAGQYLTLKTEIDGEELRRSYSICSCPDDGEMRIAVKQIESGAFSTWVNTVLRPGDLLDVMTPTGRFGLQNSPGNGRTHVAFAAGSGITPVLSIARTVLAREPQSRFCLFYGNRSIDTILFRSELEDLKDRYLERLSVFHVLSREEQDLPVLNGRLDAAKARLLLTALVPARDVAHAFLCGPSEMIEEIEGALRGLGLAEGQIHAERFVSAFSGVPRPRPVVSPTAAPAHVAALIVDGKRREVPVAADETILDAALRAGLDLPFACKGGMCSTCRAKVVEGAVEMEVNYALEPWETEAGFVLTCQARAKTDRVVIDYDQM